MNGLLYQLNEYMFFDLKDKHMTRVEINKPPPLEQTEPTKNIFFPNKKDKLFWCYFILRYGFDSYNSIDSHHFTVEKKEKEKCIELLENNKAKIKQRKLKYNPNDLLYDLHMSLDMFFSLCCACDINIIFVEKKTFFSLIDNSKSKTNYIYYHKKGGYGIYLKQLDDISKTHIERVSLTKYLRSISAYRLDDVKKMCDILKIETKTIYGKPITKIELYNKIMKCIE